MNEISNRKGPMLDFILPEDRLHFENRVLDKYESANTNQPPHVADHIFLHLINDKPDQFVAAYLGKKHLNPHYFFEVTKDMSPRDKYLYVQRLKDGYEEKIAKHEGHERIYDDLFYEDIRTVLLFHRMSFIDIYDETHQCGIYYRNMPCGEVW